MRYRVVQPWGRDRGRQATLVSEHDTAEEAFHAIKTLRERMTRTGADADSVELVVATVTGHVVRDFADG